VHHPLLGCRLFAEDLVHRRERFIKTSRGHGIDDRGTLKLSCAKRSGASGGMPVLLLVPREREQR
jgi:hypothetical protein